MSARTPILQAAAAATLLSIVLPLSLSAADMDEPKMIAKPDAIKWGAPPPGLPKGAQAAILAGDPTKAGVTTVRMKMPAGYKIGPHTHSRPESVTVMSGTLYYGTGEKYDTAKAHPISAGGFHNIPANAPHYVFAKAPTVVQVHFEGPFDIKYINPADDPEKGAMK